MDVHNEDRASTRGSGLKTAVTINLIVWSVVLAGSVVNVVTTPVGPRSDPDATDGVFYAMFGAAPVFVITVVSAIIWIIAKRWRGWRLVAAVAVLIVSSVVLCGSIVVFAKVVG
ncbi:MAG TPA: hypothetical protein H9902_13095 [Candidatus Stackebrandtia faecavium]|nr:hypothetical protein [Candidatus Stackebrandtia faecavium]